MFHSNRHPRIKGPDAIKLIDNLGFINLIDNHIIDTHEQNLANKWKKKVGKRAREEG